jgi:hypothetical protein
VVAIPRFELILRCADVLVCGVVRVYSGLVDYIFGEAFVVEGALRLVSTVTCARWIVGAGVIWIMYT